MITTTSFRIFGCRLTTELTAPDHQCFIEQASVFQILQQTGDRLVRGPRMMVVVFFQVPVSVPIVIVVRPARIDLDEANSSFHQSTGQQATFAEGVRRGVIHPVQFFGVPGFLVEFDGFRRGRLHAVGQFVAGDSCVQIGVAGSSGSMTPVCLLNGVDHVPLNAAAHVRRWSKIEDRRAFGLEMSALVARRHETARPVLCSIDRTTGLVEHHHVARQVLIDRAKPMGSP